MAESAFGWGTFAAAAVATWLFAEYGDLTLSVLALCAFFFLTIRGDETLAGFWDNVLGLKNFFFGWMSG